MGRCQRELDVKNFNEMMGKRAGRGRDGAGVRLTTRRIPCWILATRRTARIRTTRSVGLVVRLREAISV